MYIDDLYSTDTGSRTRRSDVLENVIIETVVILDEAYVKGLRNFGHSSISEIEKVVHLKWMGVRIHNFTFNNRCSKDSLFLIIIDTYTVRQIPT